MSTELIKSTSFSFKKCIFRFLRILFSFSLTWTLWAQKCQNATPPTNHSRKFSWIFVSMVLTKLRLGIWTFEFLILTFFSKILNSPLCLWGNQELWKTKDRRAKLSEIWDLRVVVQHIWGTFGLVVFKVILGSFGALPIFPKIRFPKTLLLLQIAGKIY